MGNLLNKFKNTQLTQMKFLVLALAVVAAQDEEEAAPAGCGDSEEPCGEGECCGATAPEDGDPVTQCGASDAATVTNDDGDDVAFACAEEAGGEEEAKASGLTLAAVAMSGVAYYMI